MRNSPQPLVDLYETSPKDTNAFMDYAESNKWFSKKKKTVIFEPCAGNGAIANVLKDRGYKVIEHDFNTKLGADKVDYLNSVDPPYDFLITNPPYAGKSLFIMKAINSNKPWAMLLPLETLLLSKMPVHFNKGLLVLIPTMRPKFKHDGKETPYPSAWFVGNLKGMQGITIEYLDMKNY